MENNKDVSVHKDLTAEIDAVLQNSKKRRIPLETNQLMEIFIDKENSEPNKLKGSVSIISSVTYIDGTVDEKIIRKHDVFIEDNQMFIEKYDPAAGFTTEVMKMARDILTSIANFSKPHINTARVPITTKNVFVCSKKQIIVICDSGKNSSTKELVDGLLFSGQANSSIDIDLWDNGIGGNDKGIKWAFLEIERRIANNESVIVTGIFKNWYELMPIAVIALMYNVGITLGRIAGQKLSIGGVLDVNIVLEHFMLKREVLQPFFNDPYSAIEYFKQIDGMINSLVIFPSILHAFFAK